MASWIDCKNNSDSVSETVVEFQSLVKDEYKSKFNENNYEETIAKLILDCSEKANITSNIHWSEERDSVGKLRYLSNNARATDYATEHDFTPRIVFDNDIHVTRHIYRIMHNLLCEDISQHLYNNYCSLMCANKEIEDLYDAVPIFARPRINLVVECDYFPTAKDLSTFICYHYEKIYCRYCFKFIMNIENIFEDFCHKCIENYFL